MVSYAYLANRTIPSQGRYLLTFSTREVADEWWRQAGPDIQRASPQFYSYSTYVAGAYTLTDLADSGPFKDKMFVRLMPNSNRFMDPSDVIPSIDLVDHVSGNWFSIRSKGQLALWWFLDESTKSFYASSIPQSNPTPFRISLTANCNTSKNIMIGDDDVTIGLADGKYVGLDGQTRSLVLSSTPSTFKFRDLTGGGSITIDRSTGNLRYALPNEPKYNWVLI